MRAAAHRSAFLPLMAGLIALAWLTLWVWSGSPYGRYLDHGSWMDAGLAAAICRALPVGEVLVPGLWYVGSWVLMIAAMMLPTTLPLLDIFRRLTADRADRRMLLALVIAGYLAAWALFGVAAHATDWAVHAAAEQSLWLGLNGWIFGCGVLALAGLFQFSALKYRCLDKCRAPFGFVVEHWRGRRERVRALSLGLRHGLFCVGCCWALMMLMFVVGTGSVGWMLLLGAIMAAEKNLPWGRRLSTPLGIVLIAGAVAIAMEHLGPWG